MTHLPNMICVRAYKEGYVHAVKRAAGDVLYLGRNLADAAKWLEPGTTYGTGDTEEVALAVSLREVKSYAKEAA